MSWKIPLAEVTIGEEEVQAASAVLRSGWLTQGGETEAFEQEFAEALGVEHAVAVTNGTAGLQIAYAAAGLGPGDEFLVPDLTFVATMNAGIALGARPVPVDCTSPDDLTISIEDVARRITPRTRLIVPMSYGGFCPDMAPLMALAKEKNIAVVEDACHSPLARLDGQCIGTFGACGVFSFFGNKNMTTGEGGMVVTRDDAIVKRLRALRSHGMTTLTWDRHRGHASEYDVTEVGYNFRFDEVRAAIGRAQLRKLSASTALRATATAELRRALEALNIEGLEIPFSSPRGEPAHHLFVVLLPEGTDRERFRRSLAENGIQTSVHYPLLHRFTVAQCVFPSTHDFGVPVAESLASRLTTLPMGPHIDSEAVSAIANCVASVLKG
jgi:dTDP-4-amino-4,6-dideoxygalactose transaminase